MAEIDGIAISKAIKPFLLEPDGEVDLKKRPTVIEPLYATRKEHQQQLDGVVAKLRALQTLLYASSSHAILVIFQGMDASGKDGCIKHVMSGLSPLGCSAVSFSEPSTEEARHDFLWRTTCNLPERGKIGIFNRSYYEEVLIVRVHPELLLAQALPGADANGKIWTERYRSIAGLERHLTANGTRIVKIYLHISKDEQRRRLLERIDTPEKNWKIKPSDIEERKFWKQYRKAYEDCFAATSTREAPWYVVPADDKLAARLFVSHILVETLEDLKLTVPKASPQHAADLVAMRKQLEAD